MSNPENISQEKKEVIRNLYLSRIGEEFIAMQLDLEIPIVIRVLKEVGEYKSWEQIDTALSDETADMSSTNQTSCLFFWVSQSHQVLV